jgi:hypothetical protein
MELLTADLSYWIAERYSILLRRRAGVPAPWSADPIFNSVRFCNVHREDDAVTQWVRKNWNKGDDGGWRFVLARMLNWPESLAEIAHTDDIPTMRRILRARRGAGKKIFTSAYTISTCGQKMDKLDYVLDMAAALEDDMESWHHYNSLQDAYTHLMKTKGIGSFLAAQVVADMKNTYGHPLTSAPDWWEFSAPGPGSLRGLSWFFTGEPTGVTPVGYALALTVCRKEVDYLIPEYVPRISNQDFQNCLCEFSKYCKVKYLNGHVRNKYVPHN